MRAGSAPSRPSGGSRASGAPGLGVRGRRRAASPAPAAEDRGERGAAKPGCPGVARHLVMVAKRPRRAGERRHHAPPRLKRAWTTVTTATSWCGHRALVVARPQTVHRPGVPAWRPSCRVLRRPVILALRCPLPIPCDPRSPRRNNHETNPAILAGIAVLALALTSTAGAADGTLAAIGQKSSTASLAFTKCQTRACKVRTGTVFLKADTQFLNHVMARAKAGAIRPGTPCFRAALRLSRDEARAAGRRLDGVAGQRPAVHGRADSLPGASRPGRRLLLTLAT